MQEKHVLYFENKARSRKKAPAMRQPPAMHQAPPMQQPPAMHQTAAHWPFIPPKKKQMDSQVLKHLINH
jgi:hypothetical protein